MATPKPAQMVFVGRSGKTYSLDLYVSDVNGALINWDGGAGASATSPTFWIAPEDCVLRTFSMVTGTADTEKIRLVADGKPTAHTLRYDVNLSTIATRPPLNVGFKGGTQVSAFQISD